MILLIKFKLFISKRFNKISFLFNENKEKILGINFSINLSKVMEISAFTIDKKFFFQEKFGQFPFF